MNKNNNMTTRIWIYSLMILGITIMLTNGCTKETPALQVPVLTTTAIGNILQTTATSGGNISSDGGAVVTARGVCYSTTANPTTTDSKTSDSSGIGTFTSSLTGLVTGTTYYVRAYATNSLGTNYGQELSFIPDFPYGTFSDIDGNVYKTIKIGTQTWMAENLKTTKYNDGTDIPLVEDAGGWAALSTPGYCWYNNDATANKATYGALYNWYTVNTGKLCPTGWHVPSDAEWAVLINYLGGKAVSGSKLKEIGLTHWLDQNPSATNETGFTALPGGYRQNNGSFVTNGFSAYWWSSTEITTSLAACWWIDTYSKVEAYGDDMPRGFSVRCIKDE
jgi:uncharacterized protein (TIGR02145 family)